MASQPQPTTVPPTTNGRTPHTTRVRLPLDFGSQAAPSSGSAPRAAGQNGTLRSVGRFLMLAANPIRAQKAAVGGLLTTVIAGGVWYVLSWVVAPATKQMHVHTPFGSRVVSVAISRWPWAVAIACVLGSVLILIAGIRLQLKRDSSPRSTAI